MLSTISSTVGMSVINSILGQALEAFKAYENKTISIEQLKDQLYAAMVSAAKDVEARRPTMAVGPTPAGRGDGCFCGKRRALAWTS